MAQIPCTDYITDPVPIKPETITCTERTCLKNRFAAFCMSMDLSPEQKDAVGAGVVAWTLWDLPALHAAQIDDDRGEDLITIAIQDRIYYLDYERNKDEWNWNAYAPIPRLVRFGPIPANQEVTSQEGYDLSMIKRFREFFFSLDDGATGAGGAFWEISVGEWNREQQTTRTTTRRTTHRMRTRLSTKGRAFVVTLRHSADEPVNISDWRAEWDVLGDRARQAGKA